MSKKTKVMIFRRGKKIQMKAPFTFKDAHLEIVQEYTYLGLVFTSNGSFKCAVSTLKASASKALFKLQGIIRNQQLKCPMLNLKLFDCLVRPILT